MSLPDYKNKQLDLIQNKPFVILRYNNKYTPINSFNIEVLNLMTIKRLIEFNVVVVVFKIKHKLTPSF